MRDTFTKVFPSYKHGDPTIFAENPTHTHVNHQYPELSDDGNIIHAINRRYTHKKDFIKDYTESMIKIQSIRRDFKLGNH